MNSKTYEYDPKKHAGITLKELYGLVHTAIERYRYSYCEALGDIPARRAREQEAEYPPRIPASLEEFNAEWSLRYTRTIGRFGFEFQGRYYYRPELEKLKNALGDAKRKTFTIYVVPEDIRSIYVRDGSNALLEVPCTEPSDTPLPLEVHMLQRKRRKQQVQTTDEEVVARADARIEAIAEKGRARAAARSIERVQAQAKLRRTKAAAGAMQRDSHSAGHAPNAIDKVMAELARNDAAQAGNDRSDDDSSSGRA